MEVLGEFSCLDCDMAFRSVGLLRKHKTLFCLGSAIGDPVLLRKGCVGISEPDKLTWRGVGPKRTRSPDLVRRSEEAQPRRWQEDCVSQREDNPQGRAADSLALSKLTDEFHKLRMSIEGSMTSRPKQQSEQYRVAGCWVDREKVRVVSEHHGNQLAEIRARGGQLEQQREAIEWRLAELGRQKDELEEEHEDALPLLNTHIQTRQGAEAAAVPPDSPTDRKSQHITFDLISSVDGPLSTQIRSLRLAYMQVGGAGPEVLAQMHDLQAEAHTLEQARPRSEPRTRRRRLRPPHRAGQAEVLAVEQENQRLEEQIFRLSLARERQRGDEVGAEQICYLAGLQVEMESLRREVERARERRAPPPPPPLPLFPTQPPMQGPPGVVSPPPPPPLPLFPTQPPMQGLLGVEQTQSSMLAKHVLDPLDSLGPAPYDPAAGFVIFYDLVVGVCATLRTVRLVAGLYAGGQQMGRPMPLPPVPCQPAGALPYPHSMPPGNYAMLSVKQSVPRMQPSPSLSLVVEVQAAGGLDPRGWELQQLVPRGWARLQLFDQHNQAHSGFWRVPFQALPIRPSLSAGQLNSVPQLRNMELCLRLVNARDGDVQSLAKMEPGTSGHYKYPAMVSTYTAPHLGGPPPHLTTLQPSANPFLSPLPPTDHVDPPPMEESNQRSAFTKARRRGEETRGQGDEGARR